VGTPLATVGAAVRDHTRAAPLDLDAQTVTPASLRHHRCGSPQ